MLTKAHKFTAVLLALMLLFSALPFTAVSVGAATEEHPDAITITVIDEDENPVEDAEIDFYFDSVNIGDKFIEKSNEKTDEHGTLELLKADQFVENDLTLTAEISKSGFKTDKSIDGIMVYDANHDFKITLISTTPHGVSAQANDLTYTGEPQLAVEINKAETDTVTFDYEDDRVEMRDDGPYVTDAGDYEFDVTIEREDFEPYKANVKVTVKQAELSNVEIKGKTVKYDAGNLLELVEVTGIDEEKDTVTFACENENVTMPDENVKVPSASAIGKYTISVTVERDANYKKIEKDVEAEIELGEINLGDLKIEGLDSTYTGEPQEALIITGSVDDSEYKLDYKLGDEDWTDNLSEITVTDAGDYLVKVRATRTYYEEKDVAVDPAARAVYPFNVHIEKASQSVKFDKYASYGRTSVELDKENEENNIYDFAASGGVTDNDIVYSVTSSAVSDLSNVAEIAADGKLTVKGAGSFTVVATKPGNKNYSDGIMTHNVVVTEQSNELLDLNSEEIEYVFGKDGGVASVRTAEKTEQTDNGKITYTIDPDNIGLGCNPDTGEIKVEDYTMLSEKLEASGGSVTIIVTAHKDEGTQTERVEKEDETPEGMKVVYFSNVRKWKKVCGYWWKGSEVNSEFPGEELQKVAKNNYGQDVYRMYLPEDAEGMIFSNGLSGNSLQKTEDIKDIKNSYNYYFPNRVFGNNVSSTEWTKKITSIHEETTSIFGECDAQYSINISSLPVPDATYQLAGTMGNDNWYVSDVTATPADSENYRISKTPIPTDFAASVVFTEQGTDSRYVYLMDQDGAITPRIELEDLKIDQIVPDANDMSITFSDEDVNTEDIDGNQYKFNKESKDTVNVTFTVVDADSLVASEIQKITWKYTKDGSVSSILEEDGGEVEVTKEGTQTYTATITLTADQAKQYRGKISFTATDKAGNTSESRTENSIAVLDTVNPRLMDAIHEMNDPDHEEYHCEEHSSGDIHFYSGDIKFSFLIKEANFFPKDVKISLKKDGKDVQTPPVSWIDNDDAHTGTFVISGDGDYKVYLEYTDRSKNVIKDKNGESDVLKYESEQLTIDTIDPSLSFEYNHKDKETQSVIFTVTEHNFRPSAISVTESAVDLNNVRQTLTKDINNILHVADWKKVDGKADTYQLEYNGLQDGIYTYDVAYTDVAGNVAQKIENRTFTIDRSAPSDITISYSEPWNETLLGVVSLGFYNPDVTVTFTAVDKFSGVESFDWDYTRLDEASETCVEHLDGNVKAQVKNADSDKTLFTAQITIPAQEAEKLQLKGKLSVAANDTFENKSNTYTDNNKVVVVDTISPTAKVVLSDCSRDYNGTRYYGNDKKGVVEAVFYVKEANFFPEDFKVTATKNGGEAESVSVAWTDDSVDDHVGVIKLSGDGHYTIFADYTDRSLNKMESYQSVPITIDTIAPVIDVKYQNTDVIESLTDREDHSRDYFDKTQTAVVTITEHNFFSDEVDFSSIVGKDITGEVLDINELSSKSKWTNLGDTHTITLTYSGDANYTFDLAYTDLANNEAKDYQPDYFTVDTVAPAVQSVSYSTSVLDTVISNTSFGFYGATMTVTLTATDETAGVHSFEFSYRNAPGVSSVNAELIQQAMDEGTITYSGDGRTATLVFNIPRDALGPNNQFNGLVDFESQDRSHNKVTRQEEKRVVVDNIAPTRSVDLGNPVNQRGGVSYYNGPFTGTITINEANFYSEDVVVTYSINGGSAGTLPVTWTDESVDVHIGTFTLSSEGDYIINITYTDRSGNVMEAYTSNQLTIDTHIDEPTYTINGKDVKGDNGGAYKDDINVGYSYSDQNFDTRTIKLVRTRFDEVKDVTDEFIKDTPGEKGGQDSFDIPKEVGNDGIYVLTISMSDLANHTVESHVKFTVNRFGSVYEYSDYLMTLIKDGGQYIKKEDGADAAITDDLVITEYNADKLVKDSLNIMITRDSEPVKAEFKSNPVISDDVEIGPSGWYQYEYVIDKKNFAEDGVYKISLSSKDMTDNESTSVPENSITKAGDKVLDTMAFTVDTTVPEIRNIINLDRQIINAEEIEVKYSLVDVGGLNNVEIRVDDVVIDTISDFDNLHDYNGSFTLQEKNTSQNIRLIVTDLAGNITDTASEDFDTKDLYQFYDTITLSTNLFVRWFANKPLFYGSIGGAVLLLVGLGFLIAYTSKKKKDKG